MLCAASHVQEHEDLICFVSECFPEAVPWKVVVFLSSEILRSVRTVCNTEGKGLSQNPCSGEGSCRWLQCGYKYGVLGSSVVSF